MLEGDVDRLGEVLQRRADADGVGVALDDGLGGVLDLFELRVRRDRRDVGVAADVQDDRPRHRVLGHQLQHARVKAALGQTAA